MKTPLIRPGIRGWYSYAIIITMVTGLYRRFHHLVSLMKIVVEFLGVLGVLAAVFRIFP
jgi:hypothetical protein